MSEESFDWFVGISITMILLVLGGYLLWERHLTHIEVMAGCLQ